MVVDWFDDMLVTLYARARVDHCTKRLWTDPRIVLQAIKLAHRRGLSIWYRPEIRPSAVSRKATTSEELVLLSVSPSLICLWNL